MNEDVQVPAADELTQEEKRQIVIRMAFGGSEERYGAFVDTVRRAVPPGTCVVLRGSAVTGVRWKDQAPFDSDGPGTSDLDLTLVGGDEVVGLFKVTGFFRLDYLFLPARYTQQLISCEVMDVPGARDASDHLPLLSVVEVALAAENER